MKSINKSGKASPIIGISIFLVIVLLGGLLYLGVTQSVGGGEDDKDPTQCAVSTTYSLSTINDLSKGTSVSPSINAKINGGATQVITSSTNLNPGDTLELMINASNYIDKTLDDVTLICGVNSDTAEMYATSTNTFRIFNTNQVIVTDNILGGATNQSASANPINMQLFIDSTTKESTGDLIIVVESTNTTEINSITLSGNGAVPTDVPELYSPNSGGSIYKAFEVPQLLDGISNSYTLTFEPESGITMGTGANNVYVTAYSKQAFIDTDGSYQVGGVEDDDGTTKYEDTWDYDFSIGNV